MKHKYTVHFTGSEKEFRESLKWEGENYKIQQVVFNKSYFFILKYKVLSWVSKIAFIIASKADKMRLEN